MYWLDQLNSNIVNTSDDVMERLRFIPCWHFFAYLRKITPGLNFHASQIDMDVDSQILLHKVTVSDINQLLKMVQEEEILEEDLIIDTLDTSRFFHETLLGAPVSVPDLEIDNNSATDEKEDEKADMIVEKESKNKLKINNNKRLREFAVENFLFNWCYRKCLDHDASMQDGILSLCDILNPKPQLLSNLKSKSKSKLKSKGKYKSKKQSESGKIDTKLKYTRLESMLMKNQKGYSIAMAILRTEVLEDHEIKDGLGNNMDDELISIPQKDTLSLDDVFFCVCVVFYFDDFVCCFLFFGFPVLFCLFC